MADSGSRVESWLAGFVFPTTKTRVHLFFFPVNKLEVRLCRSTSRISAVKMPVNEVFRDSFDSTVPSLDAIVRFGRLEMQGNILKGGINLVKIKKRSAPQVSLVTSVIITCDSTGFLPVFALFQKPIFAEVLCDVTHDPV